MDPERNVTSVLLDGSRITDADLVYLTAFPFLSGLDMSRTQVTDAGLVHLREMKNLVTLRLYDTQIGDAGVKHLMGLKKLSYVMLKSTHVTREGAERLKQAIPNARLIARSPRYITNSIGMRLAPISAGEFTMGSPESEPLRPDGGREQQHKVKITRPFFMGAYEVTQEQYERVMGQNRSAFSATGADRARVSDLETNAFPVDSMIWQDAVKFCRRLSELPAEREARRVYRLPTEAEWEYACRSGTSTAFEFGDDANGTQANCDGRKPYGTREAGPLLNRPTRVGAYKPNRFGLYDMHGNVSEWCNDPFDAGYYADSPVNDPPGAQFGLRTNHHVRRGGSWQQSPQHMRAASRDSTIQGGARHDTGFRVVCITG